MRDRKGFTLIELLIVVVIIGILAAIAIPKFSATRERAYISSMRSDVRNLASQQELYYSIHLVYAAAVTEADLGFSPSARVTVTISSGDTERGWAASASHPGLDTGFVCTIFTGEETEPAAETWQQSGQVVCTGDPEPVA